MERCSFKRKSSLNIENKEISIETGGDVYFGTGIKYILKEVASVDVETSGCLYVDGVMEEYTVATITVIFSTEGVDIDTAIRAIKNAFVERSYIKFAVLPKEDTEDNYLTLTKGIIHKIYFDFTEATMVIQVHTDNLFYNLRYKRSK